MLHIIERVGLTEGSGVERPCAMHDIYSARPITHTTLLTKAWQIQNTDISVRKEKYIYKQKINRCKVILTTIN